MELAKKLKEQGWHLTEEGIKTLTKAVGSEDLRKIIDEALNRDLRDIGGGALPGKHTDPTLAGPVVLQVQRVRNISAPKSNEESKTAPRFLQLELSDGQTTIQALELEPVPSLNLNVPPGTKIYFRADKLQLMQGYLLLRSIDLQLLGGRVETLYEKWDLARTMLKYARSGRPLSGTSAPPPWVPFGKKIDTSTDEGFKSLGTTGDQDKPSKENAEFNAARNEAIALASKAAVKKVFGGGGQNIIDHNIKKILDKGFSEEEAKNALHSTRNNLERALYNLKRRKESGSNIEVQMRGGRGERMGREGKRGASLKDEAEAAKPAANTTLFDFLTTKLPGKEAPAQIVHVAPSAVNNTTTKQYNTKTAETERRSSTANVRGGHKGYGSTDRNRFENNISSSFAANRGGHSGGLIRGGGRGRVGRDDRPPLGDRSLSYNERGGPDSRKPENTNQRGTVKIQGQSKGGNRNVNERSASKSISEAKIEQAPLPNKDQLNKRRGNERHNDRSGAYKGENGNTNNFKDNNRKRNQGNGYAGGTISSGGGGNGVAAVKANAEEDFNTRMNKVIEETGNLKIAGKREDVRIGKQSAEKLAQVQQQQQHNPRLPSNSIANYSQLPNGYTYDPSKIMGFQSKETNEFAMSLLKSQGKNIAPVSQQPLSPKRQQSNSFNYSTQPQAQQTYILPNPQPVVLPPPEQFSMMPGDTWAWNKGDLCMAKYWDDGRYYEAEITAVSNKTCVVFYLNYGNHEEVLKSDILPITDAQHRPLSNMPQQQHQHPRYRGDRQGQQMYVPPHKREH